MINPFRAWNQFFFSLVSAKPLGAIRICYGLLALANLGLCAVDLDYWYSDQGVLQGDEARIMAGYLLYSPLHFLQSPLAIRIAFGFTALAALGLTVGWRTKLMSILYYGGMLSIHNRNTVSSSGADVLVLIMGFNLMISPCGMAYSVDSWLRNRRRGTEADPLILAWTLRIFQIQISLIYALAAILKCGGQFWLNGSALHYVLNNAEVRRLDISFLSQYPILINLMTYSALVFEFSLAFFIWNRAVRPAVIAMGFLLHLGILATVNIPIFGELMWVGYLAFLTPPEYAAFARAIDVRRWFGRSRINAGEVVDPTKVAEVLAAADEPTRTGPIAASQAEPARPASSPPVKPLTIRVDGPEPAIQRPHQAAPTPHLQQSAREFAEAAMDPLDSFQILM